VYKLRAAIHEKKFVEFESENDTDYLLFLVTLKSKTCLKDNFGLVVVKKQSRLLKSALFFYFLPSFKECV
jgi:hypothetical protein